MPPSRPKSPPARPQPPSRPPLPTTPKHAPKAGVISIVKPTGAEAASNQNIPHRAPPSIPTSRPYEQPESTANQGPSISTQSSPVEQLASDVESFHIQDPDNAIYEEIDDDVVNDNSVYILTKKILCCFNLFSIKFYFQYIPKPNEPPPALPLDSVYDLDVAPNASNTSSPSRNMAIRSAPAIPQTNRMPQQQPANAMGAPPPLPKRQAPNTAPNNTPRNPNELPAIPARSNAPPPLPNRPNSQK